MNIINVMVPMDGLQRVCIHTHTHTQSAQKVWVSRKLICLFCFGFVFILSLFVCSFILGLGDTYSSLTFMNNMWIKKHSTLWMHGEWLYNNLYNRLPLRIGHLFIHANCLGSRLKIRWQKIWYFVFSSISSTTIRKQFTCTWTYVYIINYQ